MSTEYTSMQQVVRILLADDHDVVRRGIRGLLEDQEGWLVCGEASNGREAVHLAVSLKPDIAVLDLEMPELNGVEATRQIKKEVPGVEVLVFTMHATQPQIREVIGAGARGYVLKSDSGRRLVDAINALTRHKPFFTEAASESLLDSFLKAPQAGSPLQLTGREREIVQLLAEGKQNKEIAQVLGLSVKTVETHRASVMRKLGLHSIADLVRFAVRNNIIRP